MHFGTRHDSHSLALCEGSTVQPPAAAGVKVFPHQPRHTVTWLRGSTRALPPGRLPDRFREQGEGLDAFLCGCLRGGACTVSSAVSGVPVVTWTQGCACCLSSLRWGKRQAHRYARISSPCACNDTMQLATYGPSCTMYGTPAGPRDERLPRWPVLTFPDELTWCPSVYVWCQLLGCMRYCRRWYDRVHLSGGRRAVRQAGQMLTRSPVLTQFLIASSNAAWMR